MSDSSHAATVEAPPFGIETKKFTMWLFILADAATFAALLFAYGYLRAGSIDWPRPFEFGSTIVNALVMTFILLTSSLTMLMAVHHAQAGRRPQSVKWIWITALLGLLFAALHLREWFRMFGEGWSLSANPLGGPVAFSAGFFSITGLHLTHVFIGIVALSVVAVKFSRGKLTAGHIETTGLYWHFVDLVWMFVLPIVYLMNAK
ncbi:MAG TPA: cytochrome c oxidase subunit 3 [Gemmatimonadales bacterium]|nr:cytochrome c oxidase subunit 3 [Gemmatimonadales bacterium]